MPVYKCRITESEAARFELLAQKSQLSVGDYLSLALKSFLFDVWPDSDGSFKQEMFEESIKRENPKAYAKLKALHKQSLG